jgi:hypothetical protein
VAGFIYQDAYLVWNTLRIIAESIELQQASTLRFELDEIVQDALSQEEKNLVTQLSVDDLVIISDIQGTVEKYLSEREAQEQWQKDLKINGARRKTLELKAKNLDQELSKGGLFRGKKQQVLAVERDRVATQLTQVIGEISGLSQRLQSLEQQRRALSERISTEEALREMHWVFGPQQTSGLALVLTNSGQFLLNYLSQMSPTVLKGRSLSQVLVYGMAWSIAECNQQTP